MPPETPEAASSVTDYLDLFEALARQGIEFVVIGGCAVGAYARLLGEEVFSADLDLLVTWGSLQMVVADSEALGVQVQKLPQPRSVPVALLEWRGREVNLLTGSSGLPTAELAARAARDFRLGAKGELSVLIADPFDLLRNKLAVNRPKDQPHISVLRRFLEEEVVQAFGQEHEPRARLSAAERLLDVLGTETLEVSLATRLIALAKTAADFRFLAHRAPPALIPSLRNAAPVGEVRETVEHIARARGFTS